MIAPPAQMMLLDRPKVQISTFSAAADSPIASLRLSAQTVSRSQISPPPQNTFYPHILKDLTPSPRAKKSLDGFVLPGGPATF
jgi:hypothetical protein